MVWLTAAIAAAWVGLGVYGLLMFPVAVSAVGIGFAVLGLLAALTGWLALSMVVRYGPFGVRVPGQGEVSWDGRVGRTAGRCPRRARDRGAAGLRAP